MIRNLEIVGSKDLQVRSTSLHDSAIRLIEGGIVECDGQFIRAVEMLGPGDPCLECKMDSACTLKLMELCAEVDRISGVDHCLAFVHKKQKHY